MIGSYYSTIVQNLLSVRIKIKSLNMKQSDFKSPIQNIKDFNMYLHYSFCPLLYSVENNNSKLRRNYKKIPFERTSMSQ